MSFAGSFRVLVYSRVKIKPVAETCSHYFLWCSFFGTFQARGKLHTLCPLFLALFLNYLITATFLAILK